MRTRVTSTVDERARIASVAASNPAGVCKTFPGAAASRAGGDLLDVCAAYASVTG